MNKPVNIVAKQIQKLNWRVKLGEQGQYLLCNLPPSTPDSVVGELNKMGGHYIDEASSVTEIAQRQYLESVRQLMTLLENKEEEILGKRESEHTPLLNRALRRPYTISLEILEKYLEEHDMKLTNLSYGSRSFEL